MSQGPNANGKRKFNLSTKKNLNGGATGGAGLPSDPNQLNLSQYAFQG